jgi:hypothetical protein
MRRFFCALILSAAGLLSGTGSADAHGRRYSEDPPSAQEKRRQLGEFLVLILIAGGVGTVVVIQGARELWACLPRGRRPVDLDDYDD